jgi:hypothetical protein
MQVHALGLRQRRRPLLNDVLMVIGGVLLAYGGWQGLAALQERWAVETARTAIRQEMATDLDRIAYRLAAQSCITRRLDEISALLSDGAVVPTGIKIGVPGDTGLDDDQWQESVNTGLANRQRDADQMAQAFFYTAAHALDAYAHEEFQTWGQLRNLEKGVPSPAARLALQQALATARGDAAAFESLSRDTLAQARAYGMTPNASRSPAIANTTCRPLLGGGR